MVDYQGHVDEHGPRVLPSEKKQGALETPEQTIALVSTSSVAVARFGDMGTTMQASCI